MILPASLSELQNLKQWVCCTLAPMGKGKLNKIPFNPTTGKAADTTNPETWADYQTAAAAISAGRYKGLGFVFAGGYMGIDLDHVVNPETGEITPLAATIVEAFHSYTEYSPSGTGLHIIIRITSPEGIYTGKRNSESPIDIEMYTGERYFTVTGRVYGELQPIQERTYIAQSFSEEFIKKPERPAAAPAPIPVGTRSDPRGNAELWEAMFASKKGAEIKALYEGDTGSYGGDHSRADQALINHLCYWTNGDATRIDELFRETGLYASEKIEAGINKWDKRHGSSTYGERTIQRALSNFTPYVPKAQVSMEGDSMDQEQKPQQKQTEALESVHDYIYGAMGQELQHFQSFKDRKTGYSNIDAITSLYPGLYVIGAISSLGKTTFIHQLGDQLAAAGDHVLYFSLEQTRLEMVTKGISRTTARNSYLDSFNTAVSAIDIRRGRITEAVKQAAKNYAEAAKTATVIECGFDTDITYIVGTVQQYISSRNVKPVVIVDYLQIIRPADPRQAAKDAVDANVRALKKLQTDNDLVVMVICSLNRQNYLTPVDFESFKESGGIEYTADVVWGLQLSVMNEDMFNKEGKIKEKREKVKAAKLEVPRKVQLVCLKNRYGKSSYECGFNYYPQYDLFAPEDDYMPVDDPDNPF